MKFTAPEIISHFEFDNVDYSRDEDGFFEIRHPDHIEKARLHGAIPHVEGQTVFTVTVEHFDDGLIQKLADAKSENDDLRARLAALEALMESRATATPPSGEDALGDTSEGTGGTPEGVDLIGPALALDPKFDEMSRDELVDWLASVGVVIPGNVSTNDARKAVVNAIADYEANKG